MATDIISSATAPTSTRIQPLRVWIRATANVQTPNLNQIRNPSHQFRQTELFRAPQRPVGCLPRRGTTPYRILQNLPAACCAVVGAPGECQTESIFARAN